MAFKLLAARDKRDVDPHSSDKSVESGREKGVIEALADELSQHHYINRFFPVATDEDKEGTTQKPVTFEEVEEYGDIELPDKTPPTGNTTQRSTSEKFTPNNILTKINERQEAEFQSEKLANPFHVREKKNQ